MTTTNRWADPEGSLTRPRRVKYRVRDADTGAVVTRMTSLAPDGAVRGGRYYHSLDNEDLHLARRAASLLQRACGFFYLPDDQYEPLAGVNDVRVTDDDVRERIHRIDLGESSREAERVQRQRYPLADLPWDQQRALVEQLTKLYSDWQFEWIGEATEAEEAEYQQRLFVRHESTLGDPHVASLYG